ncbi:hypothetical protein [Actinoplanes sp. DH11]|uniref:hypothetical protein n=1 Tax=Actinoplanes sp. DH11 TaxID=2857011 RepID=UPI001E426245|nr:hypothetical protein [Actinoplanes sp. DH11]
MVAGLAVILTGSVAIGALAVAAAQVPVLPWLSRTGALLGSALAAFLVLLALARLLLARPAPLRALWPAAVLGAVAVTTTVELGTSMLPELVRRTGRVYGAFAGVAGGTHTGRSGPLPPARLPRVKGVRIGGRRSGRADTRQEGRGRQADHPGAGQSRSTGGPRSRPRSSTQIGVRSPGRPVASTGTGPLRGMPSGAVHRAGAV